MKRQQSNRGFSLIELMIAITVSVILLAGVILVMVSSKRSYNVQHDMAVLQENARFATEFIIKDLRMAGFYGCAGNLTTYFDATANPAKQLATNIIPGPVIGLDGAGEGDSDVIRITYANTKHNALHIAHCEPGSTGCNRTTTTTPFVAGNDTIPSTHTDSRPQNLSAGDQVIISDCGRSDMYVVASTGPNSVTLNMPLDRNYDNQVQSFGQSYGAAMYPMISTRYFIGKASSGDGFSLYQDGGAIDDALDITAARELLTGVENMQLRYGQDTNGDNQTDIYQRADQVTNWTQVQNVRITLLMQTRQRHDGSFDAAPTIAGTDLDPDLTTYTPADTDRNRTIFTTSVTLRNSMGG